MAKLDAATLQAFGLDLRVFDDPSDERGGRPDLHAEKSESTPGESDLCNIGGVDNLIQAIRARLLSAVGELAELGHPRYGSRLHEIIGQPDTPATRSRAKMYALAALSDEPRIKEILELNVRSSQDRRGVLLVEATVRPVRGGPIRVPVEIPLDRGDGR